MIIHKCARCGRNGANVISDHKFFCAECVKLFGTCHTCANGKRCGFNDDPAPIPKIIMQRSRQETELGYVEQIRQTINPQRAKAFCVEAECVCHKECEDKKIRCMRQFGVCEKYEEIEF